MTKAKEALDEIRGGIAIKDVKWIRRRFEIVYKALKLLDMVERGGEYKNGLKLDYIHTTPNGRNMAMLDEINDKYILIERDNV